MPRTIERRTTHTSRRTAVEGADQIKTNLTNIAQEIARVRDQAREEVNALEKIRGMLDTGYLEDLLRSIQALETRIEELEDASMDSQASVERYRRELETEQDRLAKLWDAYKGQEDELERLKRDYPLMEEKLFERERTIENLSRDVARLEPLSRYKKEAEELEAENRRLQGDLDRMEDQVQTAQERVHTLEDQVESLRELEPSKQRAEELEHLLEEERERLAKLYKVYEDLETEKRELEASMDEWNAWFRKVQPAMQTLCNNLGSAPGS